jgi:hypothetical protein
MEPHTNQPTRDLEDFDILQGASGTPSVCLAISAVHRIIGLSNKQTKLFLNRDCAYANDFTSRLETPIPER